MPSTSVHRSQNPLFGSQLRSSLQFPATLFFLDRFLRIFSSRMSVSTCFTELRPEMRANTLNHTKIFETLFKPMRYIRIFESNLNELPTHLRSISFCSLLYSLFDQLLLEIFNFPYCFRNSVPYFSQLNFKNKINSSRVSNITII